MNTDNRKIIILFVALFLISFAMSVLAFLVGMDSAWYQVIHILHIVIALFSMPWFYLAATFAPDMIIMFGELPTNILIALITALGFSINIVLAHHVLFVRKWKQMPNSETRIKIAKKLIMIIVGINVLSGALVGYILPRLGGHGPIFSSIDIPFIFIGGLGGYAFAYLSVLTSKYLDNNNNNTYVYVWCIVMIIIGVIGLFGTMISLEGNDGLSLFVAVILLIPGIIAVFVLVTKAGQRQSENV